MKGVTTNTNNGLEYSMFL